MLCRDHLADDGYFWQEIHTKLTYLHGRVSLSGKQVSSNQDDALAFLWHCSDAHFLDFVEYLFLTRSHGSWDRPEILPTLNEFFRQDDLPYAITGFIWTQDQKPDGSPSTGLTRTATPQVIRKDSELLHQYSMEPALEVLRNPIFQGANNEFLAALSDFRKADYGDCLTKCGSALESVLKIICREKRWPVKPADGVASLLHTVVEKTHLEPFFAQPLLLIAMLRNKLSSAHGAGPDTRNATEAKAQFAINATATAVLLLVASANL